jgi:hypothetical protein
MLALSMLIAPSMADQQQQQYLRPLDVSQPAHQQHDDATASHHRKLWWDLNFRLVDTNDTDTWDQATRGWNVAVHPRMMADVNGDGRADIVGFGEIRVFVWLGQEDGSFTEVDGAGALNSGPVYSKGWRIGEHIRIMADANGDGRADIVGFGGNQVFVWLGQEDGKFVLGKTLSKMAQNTGWNMTEHVRTMADVNGDGKADVVGFGGNQVIILLGNADGGFTEFSGGALNAQESPVYGNGWRIEKDIRIMADVNGDSKADIVGINDDAVFVYLGQSDGKFVLGSSMAAMNTMEGGWSVANKAPSYDGRRQWRRSSRPCWFR